FAAAISNSMATLPGLTIYSPDIFGLLDNVAANPTNYDLLKPNTFVISDLPPSQWALNGPGTNYVFWDDLNPTAKFQMWIADATLKLLPPVQFNKAAWSAGNAQLDASNIPIGRDGVVEGTPDFSAWSTIGSFDSTN